MTEIGDYAFSYCESVTSISLMDGVETIGKYAFYGCINLTTVTVPASVREIGDAER